MYLQLALRNIFRNRQRTIITIITICLGYCVLGVLGGMLNNIFSRLKEQAIINEKLGNITIVKKGYFKKGKVDPKKYLWNHEQLEEIEKIIKQNSNVLLFVPRLEGVGMLSNGEALTIFVVNSEISKEDSLLTNLLIDGRFPLKESIQNNKTYGKYEVSIASGLASGLSIKKGDILSLLVTTKEGMANAIDAKVKNIFNSGNPATEDKLVLMNFNFVQELYDTKGAEKIVLILKDMSKEQEDLKMILADLNNKGFEVEGKLWNEISVSYTKVKNMFNVIFRVLTVIITFIILLMMLNTITINIIERKQEIGTLRAMGVKKKKIIYIFIIENLLMTIIACLLAMPILFLLKIILKFLNITFVPPVASIEVPINLIFNPTYFFIVFGLFVLATLISSFLVIVKELNKKITDLLNQISI